MKVFLLGGRLGLLMLAMVVVTVAPAMGQVILKVGNQPEQVIDASGSDVTAKPRDLFESFGATKGIAPPPPVTTTVFLPRFRVDTTDFSDTTLWSARNNSGGSRGLEIAYFTSSGIVQSQDSRTLQPGEVVSVNIRDIPGLATTPSGVALGYLGVQYEGRMSLDAFQVDVSDNLASTQDFVSTFTFCTNWISRFLKFTASDSSILTFFVNGPLGVAESAPPTVTGKIFDEAGIQVDAFEIFSANFTFVLDTALVVPANLGSGAIELQLNSVSTPRGVVSVEHRADGKFSVGLRAYCDDILF